MFNVVRFVVQLETPKSRTKFASSISEMAKENGFDGVDLAWQFPVVTEKKEKNTWGEPLRRNFVLF